MIPGIPSDVILPCNGSDAHISEEAADWAKAKRICKPCVFKAVCGTSQGYDKHRRRGEKPCEPCHVAEVAYRRELARKRAAA